MKYDFRLPSEIIDYTEIDLLTKEIAFLEKGSREHFLKSLKAFTLADRMFIDDKRKTQILINARDVISDYKRDRLQVEMMIESAPEKQGYL